MKRKFRKNINCILVFLLILSNLLASPFNHVKAATDEIIFTEGFESGSKTPTGYANGTATLSSGIWTFESALIDGQINDKRVGSKAVRTQGNAAIYMTFDKTDVKDFSFKYANYGSEKATSWTVFKSTDSGTSWVQVDTSTNITGTLTEKIISVNQQGKVRFKIAVSATGSNRFNIDDVKLTKLTAVEPPDTTPPTVTANPVGGTYSSEQSVTLTASEAATIYYTLDGTDPTATSTKYTQPINISSTTTLKFMAIDTAGNQSEISTENYILDIVDITPPTVTANPKGGTYTSKQSITLSASELATIYYTLDSTDPTTTSSIYSEPITISSSKTLKFMAVDTAENQSTVNTETYTIDLDTPAVIADKDALAISYGDGDSPTSVTKNITLPVAGQNGSIITWSSNNLEIVTNNGLVTRPSYGTGDKAVTLTATIQKGTASATKTFTITVKQKLPQNAIFVEGFESNLKLSDYKLGTLDLPSGKWTFDGSLIGNLSGDKKNQLYSVRARVPGSFYMNFDVSNVKEVIFSHANYGNETGGTWRLLKSTDAGENWVEVGSSNTISTTLSTTSFPVNQLGNVRFKVEISGTTDKRLNFDDFVVIQTEQAPQAPIVNPVTEADIEITGSAEPAATVTARVTGKTIGETTTSDDGTFSITIPKQAAGTIIVLTAKNTDGIESNSVEVTVGDVSPPSAPIVGPITSADEFIRGIAEAGAKVVAKVNNVEIGSGVSNETESFIIPISKQKVGTTIEVTAIDTSQNVSNVTKIIVTNSLPVRGHLDTPQEDQTIRNIFSVSGWFLDESGVNKIEVLIDGKFIGEAVYGSNRPDVANRYPEYNNINSGFNLFLDASTLSEGKHTLVIKEYNNLGGIKILSERSFRVTHALPAKGFLDSPKKDQTISGTYTVAGWFLDGSGVSKIEVIVDGVVVGEATYGHARLDVFNVLPEYKNSQAGFKYSLDTTNLSEGQHNLIIREYNYKGEQTSLPERSFSVTHTLLAKGFLDSPQKDQTISGKYTVAGWFLDGSGVKKIEVIVDDVVVGEATYGITRPDVFHVFPEYKNSQAGFKYSLDTTNLTEGKHTIIIREYNNNDEQTTLSERIFWVTHNLTAKGFIDLPNKDQTISGMYTIAGWFLDGSGVSKIEVIVDGIVVGEATYGITRIDVFKAFPEYQNSQAGYKYLLDTTKFTEGKHTLVIKEYNNKGEQTILPEHTFYISHKL
jgi:hypothetical protein